MTDRIDTAVAVLSRALANRDEALGRAPAACAGSARPDAARMVDSLTQARQAFANVLEMAQSAKDRVHA